MLLKSKFLLLFNLSHFAFSYRILINCCISTHSHVKGSLEISGYINNLGHTTTFEVIQSSINFSKGYIVSNTILPSKIGCVDSLKFKNENEDINVDLNQKRFMDAFPDVLNQLCDLNYNYMNQLLKEQHFDLFMRDFLTIACQGIVKKNQIPLVVGFQSMDYIRQIKSSYQTSYDKYAALKTESLSFLKRYKYQFLLPLKGISRFLKLNNSLKQIKNKHKIKGGTIFGDNKYAFNIVNSFFDFETATNIPPNYHVVGPLSTLSKEFLDGGINQFLNNHNKVLFTAFGSYAILGPKTLIILLQSILQAIETKVIDGVIWGLEGTTSYKMSRIITLPNNTKQYDINKLFNNEYANIRLLKWA